VARAWAAHPLVGMARHRKRLAFYEGLRTMLRAGLPLPIAFADLSRGSATDPFLRAVAAVGEAVGAGAGLAEAMRRHPRWFEQQVVELLAVGEVSGTLEGALERVVAWMREMQQLRWRTLSLCLYPGYLLTASLVGGSFLDGAGGVMQGSGTDSVAMAIFGSFLVKLLQVSGLGLAVAASPLVLAALDLEEPWERVRAHLPLLGRFHRERQASRFCQILGASLGAGLEAGQSLRMALEASGSSRLRARAGMAEQRLRSGASLTDVVEWLGVLEGESLRRVATGERTGHIEPTFVELARELSESGLRWLRTLVFAVIVVMAGFLFAKNVARIFQFQTGYYRMVDGVGRER
jgi:type II secretory pathway component PulF